MNDKLLEVVMGFRDKFSPGISTAASKSRTAIGRLNTSVTNMRAKFSAAIFSVKGLVAALAGMVIIRQVTRWMAENVAMANAQETAVVALNAALMATGIFSDQTSKELQSFATQLQNTLGIADEATLEILALGQGMAKLSAEDIPRLMTATVQLSSLLKVDLKNASQLISKTLVSNVNALTRYAVEVDLAGDASARLTQIIEQTSVGMDIAEATAATFEGRTIILSAAWGDFREQMGMWITQSPIVNSIITVLTGLIIDYTEEVENAREASNDLVGKSFAAMVKGALAVTKVFVHWIGVIINLRIEIRKLAIELDKATLAFFEFATDPLTLLFNPLMAQVGALVLMTGAIEDTRNRISVMTAEMNTWNDALVDVIQVEREFELAIMAIDDAVNNASDTIVNAGSASGGLSTDLDDVADAADGAAAAIDTLVIAADKMNKVFSEGEKIRPALSITRRLKDIADAVDQFGDVRVRKVGPKPGPGKRRPKERAGEDIFAGLDVESLIARSISGFGRGGLRGAAGALLPAIGSAFGPIGTAIGGLLGGLFGTKQRQRGNDPSKPVFVSDINVGNTLTDLLNISKSAATRRAFGGINGINAMIRAQAGTAGAV